MTDNEPLDLKELETPGIRKIMLKEYKDDLKKGRTYDWDYLRRGAKRTRYNALLEEAIKNGNTATLAAAIKAHGVLRNKLWAEKRKKWIKVPYDAHEVVAELDLNRLYVKAVCILALKEHRTVEVYRAREAKESRGRSDEKVGKTVDPADLLAWLRWEKPEEYNPTREDLEDEDATYIPGGNHSGISVRFRE